MDVAISDLRSNLRSWVDRARAGERVVVTERGVPVARLVAVDAEGLLERLEREGVLTRARSAKRPRAGERQPVPSEGSVSDLVGELRRGR